MLYCCYMWWHLDKSILYFNEPFLVKLRFKLNKWTHKQSMDTALSTKYIDSRGSNPCSGPEQYHVPSSHTQHEAWLSWMENHQCTSPLWKTSVISPSAVPFLPSTWAWEGAAGGGLSARQPCLRWPRPWDCFCQESDRGKSHLAPRVSPGAQPRQTALESLSGVKGELRSFDKQNPSPNSTL